MSLPSSAEQDIERHMKQIEEIRSTAFRKELEKDISKRVSDEELSISARAFYRNYVRIQRAKNLVNARAQKGKEKEKEVTASPISQ